MSAGAIIGIVIVAVIVAVLVWARWWDKRNPDRGGYLDAPNSYAPDRSTAIINQHGSVDDSGRTFRP